MTKRPKQFKIEEKREKFKSLRASDKIRRTNAWKKHSEMLREEYPLCQWEFGCYNKADSVHHIEKIIDKPEKALWRSNTIPLCNFHHAVAETEEGKIGNTIKMFSFWITKQKDSGYK